MTAEKAEPLALRKPCLGILGAMEVEVNELLGALEGARPVALGPTDAWVGTIAGVVVAVAHSGVGKVAAAAVAQGLTSALSLGALINTGVAGALSPELSVGDMVVSRDALYHDVDVTALGYPHGRVPGFPLRYRASHKLRELVAASVLEGDTARVVEGTIASGDQFINSPNQRARIRERTGALCCDMEGAAIAQVAAMNGLPFVICRAISDEASGISPVAYARFEPKAAHAMAQRLLSVIPALGECLPLHS